jgi:hypothetical protein
MSMIEQQIWAGILIVVVGAIIIGGVKTLINNAMMAFQCLKDGQRVITEQCQTMTLQLKAFEGKFEKTDQWMLMHHENEVTQFATLTVQMKECREMIANVPCKK